MVANHLAVEKQTRPQFWYSNKEGLYCGENGDDFLLQVDLIMRQDLVEDT